MIQALEALRAIAEPTRLRIVVVLDGSELTVGELCRVLGQSQPRVSRHLRVLCDAGVLERHAEGTSAFYRAARAGIGRDLVRAVLPLVDVSDAALERDRARLATIRLERTALAAEYFGSVAARWDRIRGLHVGDAEVEAALVEAIVERAPGRIGDVLDIGTGTGRILELLAPRAHHGLGIDSSREMLRVARSRLEDVGVTNASVRQGNAYDIDVASGSVDVAILHHVLHFLDDPAAAVVEAGRVLRPGGTLAVVDFSPHEREVLRTEFAHRRLGFADDEVGEWCRRAGCTSLEVRHLTRQLDPGTGEDPLTVAIWVATRSSMPTVPSPSTSITTPNESEADLDVRAHH